MSKKALRWRRLGACLVLGSGLSFLASSASEAQQSSKPTEPENVLTMDTHTDGIYSVAFCMDGQSVASASRDGTIKMCDAVSGDERHTLSGHKGQVLRLSVGPNNLLASGGADKTVRLWEVGTGKEVAKLEGHGNWVAGV